MIEVVQAFDRAPIAKLESDDAGRRSSGKVSQRKMIVVRTKRYRERGMAITAIDSLCALFAAEMR